MKVQIHWKTALVLVGALLLPACGGGGSKRSSGPGGPSASQSSFTASVSYGAQADGVDSVQLSLLIADKKGTPLSGLPVEFRAPGYQNLIVQPNATDINGATSGALTSTAAGAKLVRAIVNPGVAEIDLGTVTIDFVEPRPNTFFVNANGSDTNTGAGPNDAWRTLTHALTQVGAGKTVILGAGVYAPIEITTKATAANPLIIRGDRDGEFTGEPGEAIIDAGGTPYGVKLDAVANVTLSGLTIRDARPGAGAGGAIWITPTIVDRVVVHDCSIYENGRGIHVQSGRDLYLEGNRISNNTGDGIVLGASAGSVILNNLIYGNDGSGIAITGSSLQLSIGLNTFYRNSGDHISERVLGASGTIADNVFSEGGADAIGVLAGTNLQDQFNLSWANAVGGLRFTPGAGSIEADPFFVNPFGGDGILGGIGMGDDDFRVQLSSMAFDRGDRDAREQHLKFAGSAASLTSRVDGTRDGEDPDGDQINLGFHYPGPLDSFDSREAGGGRLAFLHPGKATLRTVEREAAGNWHTADRVQSVNADASWVVHRTAPGRPYELSAVMTETDNETRVYVRRWNGRRWSEHFESPSARTIQVANAGERGFDIAFESVSGDSMFVYSNDDANPMFQTFTNGAWTSPARIFSPALGNGTVLWVELVADPTSDRIAMVALDDQSNLTASIWNGAAWSLPELLDTQIVSLRDFKPFDAAWESLSGDLLVVWGFSVFAEQSRYATVDSSNNWVFGTNPSTEAVGATVLLRADPTSDRIAVAYGEGAADDDVSVGMWAGSAFDNGQTRELTLQGVFGQRSIELGWIGNSGVAIVVWRDQGQGGGFMSAVYNTGWKAAREVTLPAMGKSIQSEIRAVPGENHAESIVLDEFGALHALRIDWTGADAAWSHANRAIPLATGMDMMQSTQTFSLDLR